MQANETFIKTWVALQAQFGNLLFDTDDNRFYYLRKTLSENRILVSPLATPTENIDTDNENVYTLERYISENFGGISAKNRQNFDNTSEKNRQNFGGKSEANRQNFGSSSTSSRNNLEINSNTNRQNFDNVSTVFHNENDELLALIRERANKIRTKAKTKRAGSFKRANEYEQKAASWHIQGDTEELEIIAARLKGIISQQYNIKKNAAKGEAKAKRKRFLKIFAGTSAMVLTVLFAVGFGIKYKYQQYLKKNSPTLPEYSEAQILASIESYQQSTGTIIYDWRRKKIIETVQTVPTTELIQTIDSIAKKQY